MLYTIIEKFGPEDDEKWTNYCQWRNKDFKKFDSIDGMLRQNLFDDPEGEDWDNIVNENFMLHLITNHKYACKKLNQIGTGEIIGIEIDKHNENDALFLGYDIIDGYWDVSLLTNWGNDNEMINRLIGSNGLISNISDATRIHNHLLNDYGDDSHVDDSKIISIYKAPPNKTVQENRSR